MNPDKLNDKDQIMKFCFLARLKKACGSNGVSAGMALWIMPKFMKSGPVSSLTVQMGLQKDDGTIHRLPKQSKEQITTYVEAVNFLLKSNVTDSNIAQTASSIACLKKL